MAAAEHVFRMSRRGEDGVPLRAKLEKVRQNRGTRVAELDGPEIPKPLAHVWTWFLELDQSRTSNGMGPNPITFPDIQAWAEMTGSQPRPSEVRLLKRLDMLRLKTFGDSN